MAFLYRGTTNPNGGAITIGGEQNNANMTGATIISNSEIVRVGDVVAVVVSSNNSFVRRLNAATDAILGILVSVQSPTTGGQVAPDSGTTDTWTVAADNQTSAKNYAVIDVSPWSVWSAPLSATIHTTQAAVKGTGFDADTGANAGRLLESSASVTRAAGRHFICHGVDPENTDRALVSLIEGYFGGGHMIGA